MWGGVSVMLMAADPHRVGGQRRRCHGSQDYTPAWLNISRPFQIKFFLGHLQLLEGLVAREPTTNALNFDISKLVRLWSAVVRAKNGHTVGLPPALMEVAIEEERARDATLRRLQFQYRGDESLCLPNQDQLQWNAKAVNWAVMYAQLLDNNIVPDTGAYEKAAVGGGVVRRTAEDFAVPPEGYHIHGAFVVFNGMGKGNLSAHTGQACPRHMTQLTIPSYCPGCSTVRPRKELLGPIRRATSKGCSCSKGGCVAGSKCSCKERGGCTQTCKCAKNDPWTCSHKKQDTG